MPLDAQTRLNITRWTREYIAGPIENHNGKPEGVRTIIHDLHDLHDLHDQPAITDHDGSVERSRGTASRTTSPVPS